MRIIGVDPGSACTGYGCIETDGSQHRVIACGTLTSPASATFSETLLAIHTGLVRILTRYQPEMMAVEDLFFARNARSVLKLGHVRGVVILAAAEAGVPVSEYSPAEVKLAVVGYGRAEKRQVQQMVTLLLGMEQAPSPLDVSDALAVAVCHSHSMGSTQDRSTVANAVRSWRQYQPRQQDG